MKTSYIQALTKYVQDSKGDVYKVTPEHFLKISPWKDGDDRRVYEIDNDNYSMLSFENACMIVNKQFANTVEKWEHKGKKYIANITPFASQWRFHPNPNIDLCALPLTGLVLDAESKGVRLAYKMIDSSMLPSESDIEKMSAMEEIVLDSEIGNKNVIEIPQDNYVKMTSSDMEKNESSLSLISSSISYT